MIRALVLADTHIPRRARQLPHEVLVALENVDLAIHLGDFTQHEVAEFLRSRCILYGVHGNNDDRAIRDEFPRMQRLTLEHRTIALLHGHLGGSTALRAARAVTDADVVLFGHSHRPHCSMEEGRLYFNPGSPTDRRWAPTRTYGVLTLGDEVDATLVHVP